MKITRGNNTRTLSIGGASTVLRELGLTPPVSFAGSVEGDMIVFRPIGQEAS